MVTLPVRLRCGGLSRAAPWAMLLMAGLAVAQVPPRTVATPTVEPAEARIGQPTKVRFWADIGDPNVIASGVNLLKVGAPGTSPTIVGVLKDDGTGGDEIAGDGRYSIELVVNEPVAKTLVYRISAPFKGTLLRTVTPDLPLAVVANRTPVAVPGGSQVTRTGALVQLDGRASHDLDGDLLRFRWTLLVPAGSAATLDGANLVKPSFTADVAGTYRVQLVVNDGQVDSQPEELTVAAVTGNVAPTARPTALSLPFGAGPTTSVPLVGTGSDPESQPLTLAWALKGKPATSTQSGLSNAVPPQLLADKPGRYLVELTVSDGSASSTPVQALITLFRPNTPPTVSAGPDQGSQPTGSIVPMAASASDADGDSLTDVRWAFVARPAGSTASLANPATLTPSFAADQPGDYLLEFSATDSKGATGRARVVVRAVTLPPVTITSLIANPSSGTVPLTVQFQSQASGGTGSYGYGWTFGDNTAGTGQNTSHTYTQPGTYIATVTATDSQNRTGQNNVAIVANPVTTVTNQAPRITLAAATVTLPLTLDLAPTVTDDGLPNPPAALTYAWSQVSGPAGQPPAPPTSFAPVAFSSVSSRDTTVTFDPTGPGTYVLRLTVSDGALSTSLDITVTVLAQPQTAPVIGPLANRTVRLGETLALALAGNDANARDALTYSLVSAPPGASLAPAGSPLFRFTPVAGQLGTHGVTVQVRDGANQTAQASFSVTVLNANRAPQFTVASSQNATTGVGAGYVRTLVATDPDPADALSYALVSGPGGLTVSAAGALAWTPSPSQRGDHVVKVRVTDGAGATDVAMFTLTVGDNVAPSVNDDVYEVKVGATLSVDAASGVLANDADPDTGTSAGLVARKLSDPNLGSVLAFATDGSFTFQAPATAPHVPLATTKAWNGNATWSYGAHEVVGDLNGDGYPDIISHNLNADIRARSGRDGSELWAIDYTGASDCGWLNSAGMHHRVLADIDDSGHPSYVYTAQCAREGSSWHDSIVAFDHRGKVKWVSPPVSKPHPDIRRGAAPVPPGGFTPGGLTWRRGLSAARLKADDPPVLLMRAEITSNDGYTYYVDGANQGHYAGCRAATGLVADEGRACRVTFLISGVDGAVLQTLVAPNPASAGISGGPDALKELPPIAFDVDGDGRVDLVSGTEVWKQNAAGGFDLAWQLTTPVNDTAVADLDGDGKAEIVFIRSSGANPVDERGIFVYSHDGQLLRRIPLQTYWFTPITIADVDGDGRSDIVLGADGTLYAFRDDGRPIWAYKVLEETPDNATLAPIFTQPGESFRIANAAPQVYDLDGDGIAEVVFSANSRIMILDGRTGLRKVDPYWTYSNTYNDVSALMLVDIDNDGRVDIVQNSGFLFNCGFVGFPPGFCDPLVGPIVLSGGAGNAWLPGPKAWPHLQYRSTSIDDRLRLVHDTRVSRVFRTPEQQGAVRDPRLAQATSFTYEADDGMARTAPAKVIVKIVPDNKPPVFTSVPPKSLWQRFAPNPPGGLVTNYYDLAATDPDPGDTVTFSLKSAPYWVTMSGPARIRFEPTCGSYGYPCPWGWTTVIVTATDSRGAATDQIFLVNLTTEATTVPDVVGQPPEVAKAALLAQDLQGVVTAEAFSAQPMGTVLAQVPAAGMTVGRYDDVRLTVSKGLAPVLMPNVVGSLESSARSRLSAQGFAPSVSRQFSATTPAGVVMTQMPAAGTTLPPGPAQLVVSSGNGLTLRLNRGLMPANESIVVTPVATDVDGNVLPTPNLTYAITPRQAPFKGPLPTIAGSAISAAATTMGSFVVTATDTASARTASAEFAVGLPSDANGEGSIASIARFLSVLQEIDDFGPALRAARAANDVPRMKTLLGQMVARWRTIDLDDLKDSMVIVFAQGFVPTLSDMDAFGLTPTGDDALVKEVLRDAVADLDAWTQALRGSGTSLATLNALADQFSSRAARIDALTASEYGVVLAQPEYQLLIAHRLPAFYEAVMEEAAELAGLPRRNSSFPLRKRAPAGHAAQGRASLQKSSLVELAVTQAVGYITDKIMEKGLETYKNAKKFAVDIMGQAAWGAGAMAIASHVREFAYGSSIIETVSGASLSFRVFNAPYTFIEVITNDEPSLNDVMIIGPDITANAVAAVSDLLAAIKDGFSFGKDALTNPKRYRNQDEAQKTKKELRKRVKALQDGGQALFDVTSSMYQSPEEVERGCIFDANPDCRQLHYPDGFASVYSYAPPPGFLCYSGLPLPIPIIVQDQVSGLMFFGTPAFLPTAKLPPNTPPPNCG